MMDYTNATLVLGREWPDLKEKIDSKKVHRAMNAYTKAVEASKKADEDYYELDFGTGPIAPEEQDRMREEAQAARRLRIEMYQELLVVMYGEGAYGTEEPDEGEDYPDSKDCSHYYLYGIKYYQYV
jgi:hypothetical protein